MASISSRLIACLHLFEAIFSKCGKIIAAQDDPLALYYGDNNGSNDIPPLFQHYVPCLERFLPDTQDEYGRLRVWTGNIGAHKSGRSSLEYRLRDASHVREQVVALLENLRECLGEVLAIISGQRSPEEENTENWSDGDYSEDDSIHYEEELPQPAELFQLLEDIKVVIKCLYKLSMAIRQPSQHDRLRTNVDMSYFTQFDIQHVEQKFPNAEPWLVKRLGKAITKRREYLKGRELHHEKLAQGATSATSAELLADNANSEAGRMTLLTETTATTFAGPVAEIDLHMTEAGDVGVDADTAPSETSYASTVGDDTKIHLPLLPEEAERNPGGFECPYCYYLISVRGPLSWARHIFDDLQPYICTFPDCPTPNRTYNRRRVWFNHEKTVHRSARYQRDGGSPSSVILPQISGPVDNVSTVDCPLCKETVRNLNHLERHLARHLEQLALFAMPRAVDEDLHGSRGGDNDGSDNDNPSSDDLEEGSEDEDEKNSIDADLDLKSTDEGLIEDLLNFQLTKEMNDALTQQPSTTTDESTEGISPEVLCK
ncbi:hypothetical protein AJ79_05887 [Helicocarpus griseus UAMH5409]|uniref:C2H2-type domain-containing protein n=1 Tax=Helicocarpus griseus UAMH5409 TaxID=1447875 RepID=A0A2B7XJJ3_9EURO|nr:hypothetical protein AJ79_05887 [Helicocarpus griseus UAMH5409]